MIIVAWAILTVIAAYPMAFLISAAGYARPETALVGMWFGIAWATAARWSLTVVARWVGRGGRRG